MNENKKQIIETSLQLFIQKGFNGVSLTDILKLTGLSRGTFYYYFVSKEECFRECVEHFLLTVQAEDISDSAATLKEYIGLMEKKLSLATVAYQSLDRISFFNEAIKIIPGILEYINTMRAKELKAWEKIISRAVESGEIKAVIPCAEAAKLFINQCDGIVLNLSFQKCTADFYAAVSRGWQSLYNLLKA